MKTAVLITTDTSISGFAHINCRVMTRNDKGKIEYPRWYSFETSASRNYEDLTISCQMGKNGGDGTYAHRLAYRTSYVDLHVVASMAATLRRIHKAMDKLSETLGRPATFGQFVARVAAAIGAKEMVTVQDSKSGRSTWDRDYQSWTILDGVNHIDALADNMIAKLQGRVDAA